MVKQHRSDCQSSRQHDVVRSIGATFLSLALMVACLGCHQLDNDPSPNAVGGIVSTLSDGNDTARLSGDAQQDTERDEMADQMATMGAPETGMTAAQPTGPEIPLGGDEEQMGETGGGIFDTSSTPSADEDDVANVAAGTSVEDVDDETDLQPLDPQGPLDDRPMGPILYPPEQVHSPIPFAVAEHLREVFLRSERGNDSVFMKVGASSTVSRSNLACFDGDGYDLGPYDELQDTVDFFKGGNAAGVSPFSRATVAAKVGHSAQWVIAGEPSPLEQEIEAINPRYAFVHYGTNDMGLGRSYDSAMKPFYTSMVTLLETLLGQGIIPVVMSIAARGDRIAADRWVNTYNTLLRGLAQHYRVPFLDVHRVLNGLEGRGLASDGIHLNRLGSNACTLSDEGLEFGYNNRNLVSLQVLNRLREILLLDTDELEDGPRLTGFGDLMNPFEIHALPFTHSANTSTVDGRSIDRYPSCDDGQDESGPELVYRFSTDRPIHLRMMVLDGQDVDIDVHLLKLDEQAVLNGGDAMNCLARDDSLIEGRVEPGTYAIVADTYVNRSGSQEGQFQLIVTVCDDGDPACSNAL